MSDGKAEAMPAEKLEAWTNYVSDRNPRFALAIAELLQKYGHHVSGCYSERNFERDCDCGLFALRGPTRRP